MLQFVCNAQYEKLIQSLYQDLEWPRSYFIKTIQTPVIIDGHYDSSWDTASYTELFRDISTDTLAYLETKVKMLRWKDILYIYAELEEPHVWASITQRDAVIFHDNDFEVFIDMDDDRENYTEIELNALNTVWDLKLNKPYRWGGYADSDYQVKGLKTAVKVHGTLNDPSDIDSCWVVEMAIPINALINKKKKNKDCPYMRINFSRVQWRSDFTNGKYERKKSNGKLLSEYNWVWSSQRKINMHIPEMWAYAYFGSYNKYTCTDSLNQYRYILELLKNELLFGTMKALNLESPGKLFEWNNIDILGSKYQIEFHKSYIGFELILKDENNNFLLVLNEDAKFRKD